MNTFYKCSFCERTFEIQSRRTFHQNRCINNPESELYKEQNKERTCESCGKIYTLNDFPSKRFCSKACANRRQHSEETKKKISNTVKSKCSKKSTKKQCPYCGKLISIRSHTCASCRYTHMSSETRKKLSDAGKGGSSILSKKRRSRNEIYFSELLQKEFDVLCNERMFNGWDADIIIPSLKVAILWNGKWHYEDIFGNLKQIQNRDRIKYNEIVKLGYMPYIITDLGKFSTSKCEFEVERFKAFLTILNLTIETSVNIVIVTTT